MIELSRSTLASMIDHTLLAPEATIEQVERLCDQARQLAVASVCVTSAMVATACARLTGTIPVCTVIGFPSGAFRGRVKAEEARVAQVDGATEFDVVVNLGLAKSARFTDLRRDLERVRNAVPRPLVLKVIVESAALTVEELRSTAKAALDAGADFLKTSTGFHPAGGATVEAVRELRAIAGDSLGVKASGGIRTLATAQAMIDAGATRLGMSATAAVLADCPG